MRAILLIIVSVFCAAHLQAQDSVLSRLQQRYHKVEEWHGLYKVHNAMHSPIGWGLYSKDGRKIIEPRYGEIYRPHRDILIAHPDYGMPGKGFGIVTDTSGRHLFGFKTSSLYPGRRCVMENLKTNCIEARDKNFNLIFSADPSPSLSFAENDHLAVFEKNGRLRYYDFRRNNFVHYRVSSHLGGKAALISNPATTRYGIYTDTIVYPMVYKWIEPAGYGYNNYLEKQFIILTAFPDDIAVDQRGPSYRRPTLLLSQTLDTLFLGDYASIKPLWPGVFYVEDRDGLHHWLNGKGQLYAEFEGYSTPNQFQAFEIIPHSWPNTHLKRIVIENSEGSLIVDSGMNVIKTLPRATLVNSAWPFLVFRQGDDTIVLNNLLRIIYEGNERVSFPVELVHLGDYKELREVTDSLVVLTKGGQSRLINGTGMQVLPPSRFNDFEVLYVGWRAFRKPTVASPIS